MTGQVNFNSHADVLVGRATALVNAVTPGERQGRPYVVPDGVELAAAIAAALKDSEFRWLLAQAMRAATEIGTAARPVFEHAGVGDLDAAAEAANGLLHHYAPTPELTRHDGEPWHLHFHGIAKRDPSQWGGGIAVALATVVGSEYADRLGVCEAPRCDRVFVDVSRNGTRRFCSTACQNRVKAAAHRARQAGG